MLLLIGAMACRDESKNPIPTSSILNGVNFTITPVAANSFLDYATINTTQYVFTTQSANANDIAKIDITADYVGATKITGKPLLTLSNASDFNGQVSIPSTTFATAFGLKVTDLKPGDTFNMNVLATLKDGRTFSAANTVATLPQTGSSGFTRTFSTFVACPFKNSDFNTPFKLVADPGGWQDWDLGTPLKVTAGPAANQFSVGLFSTPINNKDIIVTIKDANAGTVTVAKQIFGDYDKTNKNMAATGTGTVNGCGGTITLTVAITGDAGSYGTFTFKLQR